MGDNRVTIVMTLVLMLYFTWMDVALFNQVHNKHPVKVGPTSSTVTSPSVTESPGVMVSPFTGLSVKMMMMDQVNNYIHTPTAFMFNEVTRFSTVFYFITPNMVSFVGLLFAIAAAKAISMETRAFHYLAVALFQCRTWMDALDGIVARSRMGMVQHVSLRNTAGYVVDGVADTLGFAAFLIGCYQYLRYALPKSKYYLPVSVNEMFSKEPKISNGAATSSATPHTWSQRKIFLVVLSFGFQLALGAFFWDHYIHAYHTLLETQPNSQSQANAQSEVLRSSITWVLMWFWRISNAHMLIQMLLYAVFINKLWEFLLWIQYIGFAHILILSLFTEIHVSTVQKYIISAST